MLIPIFAFYFDLVPVPKQSVRQTFSGGRNLFYQDTKHKKFMREVQKQVNLQIPGGFNVLEGAMRAEVDYFFAPLKGFTKTKMKHLEEGGVIIKDTKPDVTDNLNKGFFDSLAGVVFKEDSRFWKITASKYYRLTPGISLKIYPMQDEKEKLTFL